MPNRKIPEKDLLKKPRLKKRSLLPKSKKPKRPSNPEEAKLWLRKVAHHLDNYPNGSRSIRFVGYAIKRYLSGRSTFEAAFGLHKTKGVPGWPKVRRRMAKAVHALKKSGKSKSQIQKALQKRGYRDTDWGTIKRTYAEFLLELRADEIRQDILLDLLQDDK